MEDEIVGVAVVLFERELRDVVPLNLLDRVLEVVEGCFHRFGGLRESRWVSSQHSQLRLNAARPLLKADELLFARLGEMKVD